MTETSIRKAVERVEELAYNHRQRPHTIERAVYKGIMLALDILKEEQGKEGKYLRELLDNLEKWEGYHRILTDVTSFGLTWVFRKLKEHREKGNL